MVNTFLFSTFYLKFTIYLDPGIGTAVLRIVNLERLILISNVDTLKLEDQCLIPLFEF